MRLAAFSVDEDAPLKIWDLNARRVEFEIPTNSLTAAFFADGNGLAVADLGHAVDIWTLDAGKHLGRLRCYKCERSSCHIGELTVSPDQQALVGSFTDGAMALWNLRSFKVPIE